MEKEGGETSREGRRRGTYTTQTKNEKKPDGEKGTGVVKVHQAVCNGGGGPTAASARRRRRRRRYTQAGWNRGGGPTAASARRRRGVEMC